MDVLIQECKRIGLATKLLHIKTMPILFVTNVLKGVQKIFKQLVSQISQGFHEFVLCCIHEGKSEDQIFNVAQLHYSGFPWRYKSSLEQSSQYFQILREVLEKQEE